MPSSNVLQFKSDGPGDASIKAFSVFFYVFMAGMLTLFFGLSENGFWLLALLITVYNLFMKQGMSRRLMARQKDTLVVIGVIVGVVVLLSVFSGHLEIVLFMGTLALLVGVYWLLVGRSGRDAPYFLRFHMLTALLLDTFLLLGYLILNAAVFLLERISHLLHLDAVLAPVFAFYALGALWGILVLFWGLALWLSIGVLMGRTPYINLITSNVRSWV